MHDSLDLLTALDPYALEVEKNEKSPILGMCKRMQLGSMFVLLCSRHGGYSVS